MKFLLAMILLCILAIGIQAQESQVSLNFVLREQPKLGYHHGNKGVKIEGIYKINDQWSVVAYATGLSSPKQDSGTGISGFLSLGTRWAPITIKSVKLFGELDAILGVLITDPYRKTVFHFRNALGVKLLDERLLIDVARLYQDILPDAAKLFKEGNPAFRYTTFNQLSAWELESYYWTKPFKEDGRVGLRGGLRYSASKFVKNPFGELGTGYLIQFEIGPYLKF